MSRPLKYLLFALAPLAIVLAAGCGNTANEAGSGPTKGVAPPNAPTNQADFYKQTQDQKASSKKGTAPR